LIVDLTSILDARLTQSTTLIVVESMIQLENSDVKWVLQAAIPSARLV
jgi:hypothetical protein